MAANGNFVVAWEDSSQDGFSSGIFARRFSSAGVAAGKEFLVNEITSLPQANAQVSSRDNGDFVVIWESDDAGGIGYSIAVKGRVFSSAGVAITGEFQVNSYTEGNQYRPSVGMDSDGDFVVAWASAQGGPSNKVLARRYSSAGVRQGDEFLVSAATGSQNYSAVTFAGNEFVVAWDSFLGGFTGADVFVRRFSSAGTPLATELQANTYTLPLSVPPRRRRASRRRRGGLVGEHPPGRVGIRLDRSSLLERRRSGGGRVPDQRHRRGQSIQRRDRRGRRRALRGGLAIG